MFRSDSVKRTVVDLSFSFLISCYFCNCTITLSLPNSNQESQPQTAKRYLPDTPLRRIYNRHPHQPPRWCTKARYHPLGAGCGTWEPPVENSNVRVLVVDDNERWRHFVSTTLLKPPGLQIIGEACDGLEAVRQAQYLRPDLILLDIGLPALNGVEAAGRIREVSPMSHILFLSENRCPEIAQAALNTGAGGYVVKSDAARELLPAIKAVLDGKRFVSACLAGHILVFATLCSIHTMQLSWIVVLVFGIC